MKRILLTSVTFLNRMMALVALKKDWENAKKFELFLEHFHDFIVRVSSTLYVTF